MAARAVQEMATKTATITLRRSRDRGHADHGWLDTYHTFSFAHYQDANFMKFGSLRVLNEDRVAPSNGFPTHPHRDAEIFSYILSGELTHRDSMVRLGAESTPGVKKDDFYRMQRGDVQFTTGGTGIAHSEQNEDERSWVHFLQIWALPWKRGLTPRYHTQTFSDEKKRAGFVNILSPLKAGVNASAEEEQNAEPSITGTIPIHADFVMGAGLIAPSKSFSWTVGGVNGSSQAATTRGTARKVYVHLAMTQGSKAQVKLNDDNEKVLSEGDGAFVEGVNAGDTLSVESSGSAEAEVVVLDSA